MLKVNVTVMTEYIETLAFKSTTYGCGPYYQILNKLSVVKGCSITQMAEIMKGRV